MINKNIWVIGTGAMAIEYAKVLNALGCSYICIGRGESNCNLFFEATEVKAVPGGLHLFLNTSPQIPDAAIVATGIETLAEITTQLLQYDVKYILLEKPGVGYAEEIDGICDWAKQKNATILLAYNRRFYASVQKAKELIDTDGGVVSFQFEFTEWSHKIKDLKKHPAEHNNWFLGNSTHVIDTAFYLGGMPVELSAYVQGSLGWHPASSIFAGAGISDKGALFSYNANWEAPGRWVIEMLTKKNRFIFKPLETLQVQEIGSVESTHVALDNELDLNFKPGLYLQTKTFLEKKISGFCNIFEQQEAVNKFYKKMANY